MISTRTPHAGSDLLQYTFTSSKMKFQPALPMRGSDVVHIRSYAVEEISTRTPHAGSDLYDNRQMHVDKAFQPALPMRGVTRMTGACPISVPRFQPALPMRGVTLLRLPRRRGRQISTRTPHAGSD